MPRPMKRQLAQPLVRALAGVLFIAAAFYLAAPGANASSAMTASANSFAALDTNLDGYIDNDEAARLPALHDAFDLLDRDGDGRLSLSEYAKAVSVAR